MLFWRMVYAFNTTVIASEARQSSLIRKESGLRRHYVPRNDDSDQPICHHERPLPCHLERAAETSHLKPKEIPRRPNKFALCRNDRGRSNSDGCGLDETSYPTPESTTNKKSWCVFSLKTTTYQKATPTPHFRTNKLKKMDFMNKINMIWCIKIKEQII